METRSPKLIRMFPLAVLIVVSVLFAVLMWRVFGGSVPLQPKGYRVDIPLPQASNLHPQADVRTAGVDVGEVVDVRRDGRRARVTIEIKARYAPLRADARAILRSKTLLGESYLELSPGSPQSRELPEGGELATDHVRPAQRLDDVLETFEPRTRERLRVLLGGMADAFGGREAQMNASLGRLAPAVADFRDVADELDRQSESLSVLLSESGDVFEVLGRRQGAMRAAIRGGDRVLRVTGRQNRALAATVRALPPFLDSLEGSFDRLGEASGDLERAVRVLRPVVPKVQPALQAIVAGAPTFRRTFQGLPPVIRAGNRGLPSLTRILGAARPALAQIHPTTREVIPVLQLMGTVRDSVTLTLANVGQIHGGYAVGPGNVVTNYVPGVVTLWNETIAGWVKRLPTHRGNAYPKPGFLNDIGRYMSYDCRHTNNVLYVPAFGKAPPCITQGPWTFNGKTAYYPRLQPSPP